MRFSALAKPVGKAGRAFGYRIDAGKTVVVSLSSEQGYRVTPAEARAFAAELLAAADEGERLTDQAAGEPAAA